jgi:hypothetical protein
MWRFRENEGCSNQPLRYVSDMTEAPASPPAVPGPALVPSQPSAIDKLRERFKEFQDSNPISRIEAVTAPKPCNAVVAPWGDDSLILEIPRQADELAEVLNRVILPERYTAIWHKKRKLLEVIFTAYPITHIVDYTDRKFTFKYRSKEYKCHYGKSSNDLLVIAEQFVALSPGTTTHRNLPSFRAYVFGEKNKPGFPKIRDAKPLSFWIEGFDTWNDDLVLEVVSHINFYMTYFDTHSAFVAVHTPQKENYARQPQARFVKGSFPSVITARPTDDNLLYLWAASKNGDPARRFLYSYQIIEYAAFSFIEEEVRAAIRKVLAAPSFLDNIDRSTGRILECVGQSTMHESQKIELLIKKAVEPELIFREINNNVEFFSKRLEFQGGFTLEPIAKAGWKAADFGVNGMTAFARQLRNIRNALSHGREQKSVSVIAPTAAT